MEIGLKSMKNAEVHIIKTNDYVLSNALPVKNDYLETAMLAQTDVMAP